MVDDQPAYREAVRSLLDGEPGITVTATAADGEEAVRMAGDLKSDVVVMDLILTGMSGVEATRHIVSARPDTKVLALSLHTDPRLVELALSAGATGFVSKDTASRDLVAAIHAVAEGGTFVSPALVGSQPRL